MLWTRRTHTTHATPSAAASTAKIRLQWLNVEITIENDGFSEMMGNVAMVYLTFEFSSSYTIAVCSTGDATASAISASAETVKEDEEIGQFSALRSVR